MDLSRAEPNSCLILSALGQKQRQCVVECFSESLGAFLVSWYSSESILPLRIGTAS